MRRGRADLLARQGPEGFNVRDLARSVGASTTVIYTLFGGREGVLTALWRDGLARLGDELARVAPKDPSTYFDELAWTYRQFALENPHYYHAVTAGPSPVPFAKMIRESRAFRLVVAAVGAGMDAGILVRREPEAVADAMFALVHGMVSLELAGWFPSPDVARDRFLDGGRALLEGLRTPPAADATRRRASRRPSRD